MGNNTDGCILPDLTGEVYIAGWKEERCVDGHIVDRLGGQPGFEPQTGSGAQWSIDVHKRNTQATGDHCGFILAFLF